MAPLPPSSDPARRETLHDVKSDGAPLRSLPAEMLALLRTNRKWWLLPVLIIVALLALLLVLGGTGAAPFIYSIF